RIKVLIVLSSAHELQLRDGRAYATGVFFNEFVTPVRAIIDAGYEPVFASPDGSPVHFDTHSVAPAYFGGSKEKMEEAKRFVAGLPGAQHPKPWRFGFTGWPPFRPDYSAAAIPLPASPTQC